MIGRKRLGLTGSDAMADDEIFKGFFSYSHDESKSNPGLIKAMTEDVENHVSLGLINARFKICEDKKLFIGEYWDETIDSEIRSSDILIVLLTLHWIESDYCRREYAVFEEVEASRQANECVAPILARRIDEQQERHLTPEQRDVLDSISRRQYFEAEATEFLKLPRARREAEIEKIAGGIVKMIEKLRDLPRPPQPVAPYRPDFAVFTDPPFASELVVLPAGEFMMGSFKEEEDALDREWPRHHVTIGCRFAIGRYPVTFYEYDQFCEATRRRKPGDERWGRGRLPVINVSWRDAQAYIDWLSQETSRVYRLPSEAEWEYACRAGTTTRYPFGDMITTRVANYTPDNLTDRGLQRTKEVGAYPPNRWGLHDLHGNVFEWVEDDWHENYRGARADGSAWKEPGVIESSRLCVLRGGAWGREPGACRSAYRGWDRSRSQRNVIGFRVARTLE
jgi:formylglycine-generating enzyme required for sulfatase activity